MKKTHQIKISDGTKDFLLQNKFDGETFEDTILRLISIQSTSRPPTIDENNGSTEQKTQSTSQSTVELEPVDQPVDRINKKIDLKEVLNNPQDLKELTDCVIEVSQR